MKLQDAVRLDRAIADSIADQLAGMDIVTDTRQRRLADFLTGLAMTNPTAERAVAESGEYFAAYYNALGESVDYDIEVLPIADCRS
ncbi:MAG: hypothetical protein OXL33_06855 [Chloroflexota bacterium]|nr:hypothetical protein [Chloroflexota bacterium]